MRNMARWAAAACVAMAACAAVGQEAPQDRLPAQEAAAGWLRLFDGQTTFGWQPRGDARWEVDGGALRGYGAGDGVIATTGEFANFDLRLDVWMDAQTSGAIVLRAPLEGRVDEERAFEVTLDPANRRWPPGSVRGVARAAASGARLRNRWTPVRVVADGPRLIVEIDGRRVLTTASARHTRGVVALRHRGSGTVRYKDVRLRPLQLNPLLNGRDLTGWKPIPGRASTFTVTPEGWLRIQNGAGDLQTETVWGDFVLQLGVFVNGDHLNSGVFFRANAGQFWSGYESQIRNQWQGDDRARPVDYGTGGVYGRQVARRVVSNDREWFTKTIIASGNHIGVWIDGYQVADYTDQRNPDQGNARRGARTAPGVISLQGHDPATDLSFRDIQVAEMPARR